MSAPSPPAVPTFTSADRIRAARRSRDASDYVFEQPGLNIFLTIITCGIFGIYVFYQLMRRDRDHTRRRYELLDAANTFAWERANAQGVADELRPAFERTAIQLETMRQLTTEFREPVVWVLLSLLSGAIAEIVGFIFIDQDLDTLDRAEVALETELSQIYARLGQAVPAPDPSRVKGRQNYVGRVIATIATCSIYQLWWMYDMQVEGNRHFAANWDWEDSLVASVDTLAST